MKSQYADELEGILTPLLKLIYQRPDEFPEKDKLDEQFGYERQNGTTGFYQGPLRIALFTGDGLNRRGVRHIGPNEVQRLKECVKYRISTVRQFNAR